MGVNKAARSFRSPDCSPYPSWLPVWLPTRRSHRRLSEGPRARWREFSNLGSPPATRTRRKVHVLSPRVPEAIYRG
jgi:hypothetical protein